MWQALRTFDAVGRASGRMALVALLLGAGSAGLRAEDLVVGDDGLLVINEDTKQGVQAILRDQEASLRDSDDGSKLLGAVPVEKTRQLTLPVIVMSNRKQLSEAGTRSDEDAREFESAVKALEELVPDRSGNWYHLDYSGADPDLEITQFCTRETKELSSELLAAIERQSGGSRSDDLSTDGASIRVTPPSYETPAQISITFIEYSIPCTVTIVCLRDDDERCRSVGYIESFVSPGRRDVVSAPQ